MGQLEKAQTNSAKEISDLKAKIKFIEKQWAKSTIKIKQRILAQAQVICFRANFSEIGLDKHDVDERIKVIPKDDDDGAISESNPVNLEANP